MKDDRPSVTALRVAIHRAAHQVMDEPRVFNDPVAQSILKVTNGSASQANLTSPNDSPLSRGLRAFVAARSRYAEDELHNAVKRGACQYVVLGAGLDTFAYRNPYTEGNLRVFEVDHPATQIWKRGCLEEAAIPIPATLTFSPVDFETQTLEEGLLKAGFDPMRGTFFSWLGVTQYLSDITVMGTLKFVSSLTAGSGIVFDYTVSPSLLGPRERQAFEMLAHRVALSGEPFQAFFDPALLKSNLRAMGFAHIDDLGPAEINARYFHGRSDGLKVGGFARVMNARF